MKAPPGAPSPVERSKMSETDWRKDSGEDDIDEQGRNPTQQRIDEETEVENEPSPHQGEEGQEVV